MPCARRSKHSVGTEEGLAKAVDRGEGCKRLHGRRRHVYHAAGHAVVFSSLAGLVQKVSCACGGCALPWWPAAYL